jgi:acyl transferase domain-containing protein
MTNGQSRKLEANVYKFRLEAVTQNWDTETELRVGVSSFSIAALSGTGVHVYISVHTKLNHSTPVPPQDVLSQNRLLADKVLILMLCWNVLAQ